MKILFIYPKMPETCWTFYEEISMAGFKAIFPPLGLLTVAALLPENWEKKLIDLNIEELNDQDIHWADFVFTGGMNVQETSFREILIRCKTLNAKIVAGGPLFTHEYERFEEVDHFILNEAEITLPLFLDDLEAGNLKRIYKTSEFADIQKTPIPLWSLAKMKKYASALVQYSRGCPHKCDFCDVTSLFGKKTRTKTPEQIIAELDSINNLESKEAVFFADDNLIGNKKELKTNFLPKLTEWHQKKKSKLWFTTQLTVNLADDEKLMHQMLDAGFGAIFVGLESPDEITLETCNKKQNINRDLVDNVHKLQRTGFEVYAGVVLGFDTDGPDIFKRQMEFIRQTGVTLFNVSMLYAPRGTELYDRMKTEGRLIDHNSSFEAVTNIIPKMDVETLFNGFETVVNYLYDSDSFYERIKNFLLIYNKPEIHKNSKFVFRPYLIKAIFNIFYTLGFKDKNRNKFWRLMLWTVKNKPDLLYLCPIFCIRGRHFRLSYKMNIAKNVPFMNKLKTAQIQYRKKEKISSKALLTNA